MCGTEKLGEMTTTVAAMASAAPRRRVVVRGCLTDAVTPRRSQMTPEITRPEMSEIWNVATPRTPTVTPSDRTMTAPHSPAR